MALDLLEEPFHARPVGGAEADDEVDDRLDDDRQRVGEAEQGGGGRAQAKPARVVGPVIRRRAGKTTANSDTPTSSAMWPAVQAGPGPWSGSLSRMIP